MTSVEVRSQVSLDELLKGVEQLGDPELETFVNQVLALRASRRAPHLSYEETRLLEIINRGLAPEVQERYNELVAKRREETLQPHETAELLHIIEGIERMDLERVEALAELANRRGIPLVAVMDELGLKRPDYD